MADPNITLTAINNHATTLEGAIRRHAAGAVRCKVWREMGVRSQILTGSEGTASRAAWPEASEWKWLEDFTT